MLTVTDLARSRLEVLEMPLDCSCKLIDPTTPPREGCQINLDPLGVKNGCREFLVSGNENERPFLLSTKLPYKQNKLAGTVYLASISTDESQCCMACKISRESASCFGRKVIELMK